MKSKKTLDDTACMHGFYVYNEYTYTSSVHFRVTSHPECTHILEAQRHNNKIN